MLIETRLKREEIRVLIVEDDADQRMLIERILSNFNYQLKFAIDGEQGLELAEKFIPDVILLDLTMPKKDGFEFLMEIRALEYAYDTPVVVMSANDTEESMIRAYSLGATDFLIKPVNSAILIMKIGMLISFSKVKNSYKAAVVELAQDKDRLNRNAGFLSQYFSNEFIEAISKGSVKTELGGQMVDATVLTLDIRGSTTIAESLRADEFADLINNFFNDISDLIFSHQGSIDKMLGDGLIATFRSENRATEAIETALKIEKYLVSFNQFLPKNVTQPFEIGIGISSGSVFVGNIGSLDRLEYVAIGEAIENSALLESLTKKIDTMILIDEATLSLSSEDFSMKRYSLTGKNVTADLQKAFGI